MQFLRIVFDYCWLISLDIKCTSAFMSEDIFHIYTVYISKSTIRVSTCPAYTVWNIRTYSSDFSVCSSSNIRME